MSKLWSYDINPYTGAGSQSPDIINSTNGVLVPTLPVPIAGETGTTTTGGSVFVPYGSALTVNGNIGIAEGNLASSFNPTTTYDWNVSIPWLNTMPIQPVYSTTTGLTSTPAEQGTATSFLATGGTNPVTVIAANYWRFNPLQKRLSTCRFHATYSRLSTTSITHASLSTLTHLGVHSVRYYGCRHYNPPAGNLTLQLGVVDFQTRVFVLPICRNYAMGRIQP